MHIGGEGKILSDLCRGIDRLPALILLLIYKMLSYSFLYRGRTVAHFSGEDKRLLPEGLRGA